MDKPEEGILNEILSENHLLWAFRKSGRCYKITGTVIDKSDCDSVKILYSDIQGSGIYCRSIRDFYNKFTPVLKA